MLARHTGRLASASDCVPSAIGNALWTVRTITVLHFHCDEPFAYTLTVGNYHSLGPLNSVHYQETFVDLQDQLGVVNLAFGESEL
jgi:hypothetical protein